MHINHKIRVFIYLIAVVLILAIHSELVTARDYWDFPATIQRAVKGREYSDLKIVSSPEGYFIFYKKKAGDKYYIEYFITSNNIKGNIQNFIGPKTTGISIDAVAGFIPQYDAVMYDRRLFLVWDNLDGSLKIAEKRGNRWKEKVIKTGKSFCFRPSLFNIMNRLFLTYHTESEGRRIDFFILELDRNLDILGVPYRIAKNFAGSFFPYMYYYGSKYYCVWQSRPFTEKETPVFNIYMSFSGNGNVWGEPVNLTEELPGEKKEPEVYIEGNKFILIYKSDRDGTWGLYSRQYTPTGRPLSEDNKLNDSMVNVIGYQPVGIGGVRYVFYTDCRDGQEKIYYVKEQSNKLKHLGPLKTGKFPVHSFSVLKDKDKPYVFYATKGEIGYIGPDMHVLPPKLAPLKNNLVGRGGVKIKWTQPEDSSGIEGFCYIVTDKQDVEPELVNLSPEVRELKVISTKEGVEYFKIRSKDRAGNISSTVALKLKFDLTPPDSPVIVPQNLGPDGYFKDNTPYLKWSVKSKDVAGFNYVISKRAVNIKKSRIRTKRNKIIIRNLGPGVWYFNLAAVDKAGNISGTAHLKFKIKKIPVVVQKVKKEKKIIKRPWIISREVFVESPVLSSLLYLLLFSLAVIITIALYSFIYEMLRKRKGKMEELDTYFQARKRKIGLRFKFSALIASLILILTVGISGVLSYVTIEKEKTALSEQMIDKAKITLENITNVAREGLLSNDELLLVSIIARTMKNKDIKYTVILDTQNRVVAHSDIKEKGKIYRDSFTIEASKSNRMIIRPNFDPKHLARLYDLASPVFFAKKRIGTVRIGYSTESIFKAIEDTKRNSIYSTIVVTVVTLLIGILGAIIMATITIKPIKVLAEGAYRIGSGDLDYKIYVKSRDEIGLLADEFNRMTERLKEYQKEMEKKAKLDEQLEIARSIQQNLIPGEVIDNEFVSIGGFYKAAAGVGGDYYDYIMKSEKYGLIISDVAGKGVPASLMMTMIRTVFRSLINSGVMYPPRVVTLINNTLISDISADRFATLLFGTYDSKRKLFQYTNAGYGPILLYRKDKNSCFLVEPEKSSIPIGVMPDVEYMEEPAIRMKSGDALILFTDGIHEARNEREEEYGMARLAEIIPKFADNRAIDIANHIIQDVMSFVGNAEQYDDMTLLVLKVK